MKRVRAKSLRWRLIGAQMFVVVVGVVTLALALEVVLQRLDLTNLALSPSDQVAIGMMVRALVWDALLVAAGAATLAGLMACFLLTRHILYPLREIARSSFSIAQGQYSQRVTVPESDELGCLATNFNQMAQSLEQVEAQRVALIGNVAHELRTPLTGLEGYLEGLLDGIFPPEAETFGQMHIEVRRLSRLVNDLQALSRIEAGEIPLNLQEVDLIGVIERVISQLRPQAQGLEVTSSTPHEQLLVVADPDRTAQLLLNLVGNAIRYTPEGGRITVHAHEHDPFAEVVVQDTGIGIPADALPYLFERFYRVDRSRARRSGGSGIGLTIARQLAWAMGGDLSAESDGPGQGSTFRFTLPLAVRRSS
ncbi:MAG: ATP-binding protein [Ardenticatenaceae bacterium]